jgi:RAD51-like protein 3
MLHDNLNFIQTVALNLLLHHLALNPAAHALWIDTTGNFSPERTVQILNAKQLSISILERLQVTLAFEIEAVQELLNDFLERDIVSLLLYRINTVH